MGTINIARISAILIQEEKGWSAQCLEYDIAVQANNLTDLHYEFERALVGHISVSLELGKTPFEDLKPAPRKYWDMFNRSHHSLEGPRFPFRPSYPLPERELRVAEGVVA